jgi:RNA polymerase sigma factor (sigma-70 family)
MSDLEFVHRCINHDSGAWDEFLKDYSRLIYNYIYHVLTSKGSKSGQGQVDDIFQELIRTLVDEDCKKLKSFKARNGASLATWLRQVTINFTLDYLRTNSVAASLDAEDEEGFALKDRLVSAGPDAAEEAQKNEITAHLKDCIGRLSIDDKYFIELHYNQHIRLEDMKGLFNISRGAVDMQKQRLILRLRDCFAKKGIALDF